MSLDGKRCCSRGKKTRPTWRNVNHVSLDGNDNKSDEKRWLGNLDFIVDGDWGLWNCRKLVIM